MIVILAAALGAVYGVRAAAKRGGNRLDKLQYGAAYAIAFGVLGVFASIVVDRLI